MEKRPTASRIRVLRRKMGLNLQEFAKLIPCDPSSVYLWEQGLRLPRGLYRTRLEEILNAYSEGANPTESAPKETAL